MRIVAFKSMISISLSAAVCAGRSEGVWTAKPRGRRDPTAKAYCGTGNLIIALDLGADPGNAGQCSARRNTFIRVPCSYRNYRVLKRIKGACDML